MTDLFSQALWNVVFSMIFVMVAIVVGYVFLFYQGVTE